MKENKDAQYREEFCEFDMCTNILPLTDYEIREKYYLAGRKKGEEDIESWKRIYEKQVSGSTKEIIELKKEVESYKGSCGMHTVNEIKQLRDLVERQFKGHRDSEEIEQWHREASEVLSE